MTDEELIERFEDASVCPDDFGHRNHLRLAWLYLRRMPLGAAMQRMGDGLRALTRELGVPEKYSETITCLWLTLMAERLAADPELDFDSLLARNPDLLEARTILGRYYRPQTLGSPLSRRTFVLPDRLG